MRRGIVILELVVGCSLLAVLLALAVQLLSVTALERRAAERRAIALEEAANLVERISGIPYAEMTPERLEAVELSPDVQQLLPGGTAKLVLAEETGDVPAKRVRVEIHWTGAGGQPVRPARLTCWFYPQAKGAMP